jgi:hypothetical protein
MPPKGVDWEVTYCGEGDKKWASCVAPKEYDNVYISRLTPGGALVCYKSHCRSCATRVSLTSTPHGPPSK